ncbi:MAG: ABC transporter permease [Bdellovibrionia bacterium]
MDVLSFLVALLFSTVRMAVPLIFASYGGLLSERSGVVNIALEGFMLVGAFTGASVAHFTQNPWMGLLAAVLLGGIYAALYAFLVIEIKANQIVTGTALNLLAIGAIPFCSKIIFDSTGSTPTLAQEFRFELAPVILLAVILPLFYFWFYKTHSGLWLRFAGEHPKALITAGINLKKVRWSAVIASGFFAATGGASLSLWLASAYSPLMSGGRGFMALAALIFGRWKPVPTLLACLFFGLADAIQIRLQGVSLAGFEIPVQFIQVLPYVVTIVALAGVLGKSRAPKALGQEI